MVAQMARGSTIPHIEEARHTLTVQPQTGMAVQPAETPWGSGKPPRGKASDSPEQELASSGVEAAAQMQPGRA